MVECAQMAWPFRCLSPQVSVEGENVRLTYWRERMMDADGSEPIRRSAFTYATFVAPPLTVPNGTTMLHAELAATSDPNRMDGTCVDATDGTLSVMTTSYMPSGASFAAVDFKPCTSNISRTINGEAWFAPESYPSRGWAYRFSIDASPPAALLRCTAKFEALRPIPSGVSALHVVEIGSTVGCLDDYCGIGDEKFSDYAGDALMRRVSTFSLATGEQTPPGRLFDLTATYARLSQNVGMAMIRGAAEVFPVPIVPQINNITVSLTGTCSGSANGTVDGSGVVGFTATCLYNAKSSFPTVTAFLNSPFGPFPWGTNAVLESVVPPTEAAPPTLPAVAMRPLDVSRCAPATAECPTLPNFIFAENDYVAFSIELTGADVALWEVVWATAYDCNTAKPMGDVVVYNTSIAVFENINATKATTSTLCGEAVLRMALPTSTSPLAWASSRPAELFSSGGVHLTNAGLWASSRPAWDGAALTNVTDAIGDRFTFVARANPLGIVLLKAAGPKRLPGWAIGLSPHAPPSSNLPEWRTWASIGGLIAWALLGALTGIALVRRRRSMRAPQKTKLAAIPEEEPDADAQDATTVGAGRPSRAPAARVNRRLAAAILVIGGASSAQAACSAVKDGICTQSGGILSPTSCVCQFGWSPIENFLLGMLIFPGIMMFLLFV